MSLLQNIILILFSAILIILILSKLKIPPVIWFLLTGVSYRGLLHFNWRNQFQKLIFGLKHALFH